MKRLVTATWAAVLASLVVIGAPRAALADTEVSILGGVNALSKNDTVFPEGVLNVPVVGVVAYPLSNNWAIEGEFTWLIPVEQDVEVSPGVTEKRKTPDILAYQANARASWPLAEWTPYVVAGAGALTFLSNTHANSLPRLDESQTVFALNFGAGVFYGITPGLGVRADFRELAAFPGNDVNGFSSGGDSDSIWMARGTLGFSFRF